MRCRHFRLPDEQRKKNHNNNNSKIETKMKETKWNKAHKMLHGYSRLVQKEEKEKNQKISVLIPDHAGADIYNW